MHGEYSLSDVLERMYQNQLALEAALMELPKLGIKQEKVSAWLRIQSLE
ncbi:hypothetical protein [Pseudomonas sp. NPDC087817]